MNTTNRKEIQVGMLVDIVSQKDKGTDRLTRGYIIKILSQANNKKGVKVELQSGDVGHVDHVVTKEELKMENFKFYNRFFFEKELYTVWDKKKKCFLAHPHYNQQRGSTELTALLFDSKEDAKQLLKGTPYDTPDYVIRPFGRKKHIVDLFEKQKIAYFRINGERKISFEKMKEWESYFRNMR